MTTVAYSLSEMNLLKEYASKEEVKFKAGRYTCCALYFAVSTRSYRDEFSRKLEAINEQMASRNKELDTIIGVVRGELSAKLLFPSDPSLDEALKVLTEENLSLKEENRAGQETTELMKREITSAKQELTALNEEIEKAREYPSNTR